MKEKIYLEEHDKQTSLNLRLKDLLSRLLQGLVHFRSQEDQSVLEVLRCHHHLLKLENKFQ